MTGPSVPGATTAPSPFVCRSVRRIGPRLRARPTALDVATGTGRHALVLADEGFTVYGVDLDQTRLRRAQLRLASRGLSARLWVADLERAGALPRRTFDVVVCTRYLQRELWPALRAVVATGGFVVYETFTRRQLDAGWGPRSSDHLLQSGELTRAFAGWEVWEDDESDSPPAEARLLARKPMEAD